MSDSILYVVSGAGLSAASGVPTFRTAGGLWTQHNIERVCNAMTWKDHRSEVFEFYAGRRLECAKVEPNGAHERLARWQHQWGCQRVRLLTQNVDDLLERAGVQEVVHLHGDLQRLQCTACGTVWPVEPAAYVESTRCPKCDSLKGVKPAVVFFYEAAPEYWHLKRMSRDIRGHDVLLVVGSALEVVSADRLVPGKRFRHPLNWQVNPEPASPEYFGWVLADSAEQGLATLEPRLTALMDGH